MSSEEARVVLSGAAGEAIEAFWLSVIPGNSGEPKTPATMPPSRSFTVENAGQGGRAWFEQPCELCIGRCYRHVHDQRVVSGDLLSRSRSRTISRDLVIIPMGIRIAWQRPAG